MNQMYYKTTTEKYNFLMLRDEMSGPPPEDAKDTETASKTADFLVSQLLQEETPAQTPKHQAQPARQEHAVRSESRALADIPRPEGRLARRQALLKDMLNIATPVPLEAESVPQVDPEMGAEQPLDPEAIARAALRDVEEPPHDYSTGLQRLLQSLPWRR